MGTFSIHQGGVIASWFRNSHSMPGSRFVLREPLQSHQSLEATSGVEQTPVGDAGGWDDDGDGDGSSGMIIIISSSFQ